MKKSLLLAIDFDNTIVVNKFPEIGPPNPGCLECLRLVRAMGVGIILWTVRCDSLAIRGRGDVLTPAVNYLSDAGIDLHSVNRRPGQYHWTRSPKVHADMFVDDKNVGTPLVRIQDEWCVDWSRMSGMLLETIERLRSKPS